MNPYETPRVFDAVDWQNEQIMRYGPIVGGESLRKMLGFCTAAAFLKARAQGVVGITISGYLDVKACSP